MKNVDLIYKVIDESCTVRGKYYGEDGGTCVIAGLAEAAKIKLISYDGEVVSSESDYNNEGIVGLDDDCVDALTLFFGLTYGDLRVLQTINDEFSDLEERRRGLADEVHSLQ